MYPCKINTSFIQVQSKFNKEYDILHTTSIIPNKNKMVGIGIDYTFLKI